MKSSLNRLVVCPVEREWSLSKYVVCSQVAFFYFKHSQYIFIF